jgi:purine-cytosine permease-like protein
MADRGVAWIILAIVLVLIATVTTTFLDIYSSAVSAQNLWPKVSARAGSVWCGILGTALGLLLDANQYQPFLIAIGAIFLPAFTVVLANHFLLTRNSVDHSQLHTRGGVYWHARGYSWAALLAWLAGFVVYDWAQGFPSLLTSYNGIAQLSQHLGLSTPIVNPALPIFPYGASLPCIVVTTAIYVLLWNIGRPDRRTTI